jgi:transposase-like protein
MQRVKMLEIFAARVTAKAAAEITVKNRNTVRILDQRLHQLIA